MSLFLLFNLVNHFCQSRSVFSVAPTPGDNNLCIAADVIDTDRDGWYDWQEQYLLLSKANDPDENHDQFVDRYFLEKNTLALIEKKKLYKKFIQNDLTIKTKRMKNNGVTILPVVTKLSCFSNNTT